MATNTYIKINFAISESLRKYMLQQPGVTSIYAETNTAVIFETTLTAQQAQNLVTQVATQKLVEYLPTVPDRFSSDLW